METSLGVAKPLCQAMAKLFSGSNPRSAQLHLDARLGFVLFYGEPLEVVDGISPAADQGFAVIYLPAWAGAYGPACARARVGSTEFGLDRWRAVSGVADGYGGTKGPNRCSHNSSANTMPARNWRSAAHR